jgi:hypothetical protein
MTKERFVAAGFSRLYIRDVPLGAALTPDTADSYPLKITDTWLSGDGELMIEAVSKQDDTWRLMPTHSNATNKFLNIMNVQVGTSDQILDQVRQYYDRNK